MENSRALKRRKVDTPEKGLSKSSPAQRESSQKLTVPAESTATGRDGTSSASEARESWKQAKAKAQEQRGKRIASTPQKPKSADVYDDIEGAHASRSRLKSLADSAPKSRRLDPLRNQSATSPAKSSPLKNGGDLDFFKRFTKPRHEDETLIEGKRERTVNGGDEGGGQEGLNKGSSDVEMQDVDVHHPVTQTGKGAWKTWAYAEKSKKTFEDQIRDLEKAAKETVENVEDKGSSGRAALRRTGRHSDTPVAAPQEAEAASNATFMPVVTPRTAAKTGGRPAVPADRSASTKRRPKANSEDDVEIEDSEPEQPVQSIPPSKAPEMTPSKRILQEPARKDKQTVPNLTFSTVELEIIKSTLVRQLTTQRPTRLTNLDDEYAKVSNMVEQTITAGESNSMLVIGSRGSGKTTLVNQILREQTNEHPNDFHVVRLNGFIHTDDKIALREIWRQLGREMDLDEEESNLKNYADTLTSLLALLSHPTEHGREQQQGQVTKSVIFILDEFERFASHPRQTLLYNLFDIAQSRKAPITVLGLTTRIDVSDSLEKRVKSRFSHRYVHLCSAKSFHAFQEACKVSLTIGKDDLSTNEKVVLAATSGKPRQTAIDHWAAVIDAFFAQGETTTHLRQIYSTTKSIPDFQTSMLLPISTLPTTTTTTTALLSHLTPSPTTSLAAPDSKLPLLSSLSTLHLALLISAARLTAIHAQDTIPFVQAYEEYKTIASKAKIQASASGALAQGAGHRIWGKEVARGIWADLVGMGLVMEDGRGGRVDVGLEEIGACGVELGAWGRWCREI